MKNLYLLLALTIGFSISLPAQTQLTNIDNPVPVSKLKSNGIVSVNGEDYLIEINQYQLRVSTVNNDSIQLLYRVSDFPFDEKTNSFQGGLDTRSGFLTDGIFLFEIFKNKIRKRNILTSELIDTYNFPDNKNLFFKNADVIGDFIHLQRHGDVELMTINTSNHEFTTLPYTSETTYRIGNKYYTPKSSGGIEEYNAVDQTTKINYENEPSRYFGFNSTLMGKKGLIFGGFQQTRFISDDTTFIIDCTFDSPATKQVNVHETDEHFIAFFNDINKTTIQLINKLDCSIHSSKVVDFNTDGQNLNILNSPIFNNDYLLFKIDDNTDAPDSIYLFDKSDLSISTILIENLRTIYHHSFFRSGDKLYFIGKDESTFLPKDKLYSINLKTKEFKTDLAGFEFDEAISFSASETDSTFLILNRYFKPLNVFRFQSESNYKKAEPANNTENIGLTPSRYLAVDDNKLVFEFKNEVYVTDNSISNPDKTYKIGSAEDISELVLDNNELKGLMNNNDSTFYFTYNFSNEELDLEPLSEYIPLENNSKVVSNYIFGDFSLSNKVYFDFNTKGFKPIPIQEAIDTMYISQNSILFVSDCMDGHCLTQFNEGTFSSLQKTYAKEPRVFSKKNGAFMIMESQFEDKKRISLLKEDGSFGDQINVDGAILEINQQGIESGPLSALMFYHFENESLEIIMHSDDKFQSFTVPYIFALFEYVIWYKVGKSIIIKSHGSHAYDPGIYVLTLDKEVKKLDLEEGSSTPYDLLIAAADKDIVTFITSSFSQGVEIVEYNIETENLISKDVEYPEFLFSYHELSSIYTISPFLHLVSFSSHVGNSEFYLFDTENLTLESLPDLNLINQHSNPHQFIESSNHLYFIARSPQDNSYQLFSKQKNEITSTSDLIPQRSNLKITPNPSSNFISIAIDADLLIIYDTGGNHIKSIKNYTQNDEIDISKINQGVYIIEAIVENRKTQGKFVKL